MSGLIPHLSISQSLVFLINSRLGRFAAPSLAGRAPFSRSYRVILPNSLAMTHSSTFGYSPRPPVSVYGTGRPYLKLSGFSWKGPHRTICRAEAQQYCRTAPCGRVLDSAPAPAFNRLFRQAAAAHTLRHRVAIRASAGILTGCPSAPPRHCSGWALGPD